jgi:small subunit ribosomal protein S15
MPLDKDKKDKIIKKFQREKGDTGSPEVQVALLTEKIASLQDHLGEHKDDTPAKMALLEDIAKRRRLLRYLSSRSPERHKDLVDKLKLKA